jgi:hypothetical protein
MIFRIKLREIARIEFLLNSYHALRISKIVKFAFFVNNQASERVKLSSKEQAFLEEYVPL